MKFVIGLLIGSLGVLALASVKDFSWQPPKRSNFAKVVVPSETINKVSEPVTQTEPTSPPIKSVTIEPLPADPAPEKPPLPMSVGQLAEAPLTQKPIEKAPVTEQPVVNEALPLEGLAVKDGQVLETAVVWKPFHSEVSADGFARRLSTQLGYPFRALREGPAKYHVVFDYGSEEQREMLRAQVKALTGFSLI